ncbi:hypothetical protein [Candidatus Methanocrinis natronophilus]|uniref:Uncharacterized protein n=1 Tax=Candidatus Methanocrinis natronophilus TaxID=3033396 RepID=A0ABT5X777_9EURY|nr:hypothetical protein [Candidatus Methanocrinis natronophilus]MDF0590554.1 hypothetical protein [Candidatus Methanocrinis natronophilus]
MRKDEEGMMEGRTGSPVGSGVPEEEECKDCGGEGEVLVMRAVCTEILEERRTCPRCGGMGGGIFSSPWLRILSLLRLR